MTLIPIDPLEEAAELEEWQTFLEEQISAIPFPESTTADLSPTFIGDLKTAPRPFTGDYVPSEYQRFEFQPVWDDLIGKTARDPATGITVPLDDKANPISASLYDEQTHTWYVNPEYTAYEVRVLQIQPLQAPPTTPAPDPTIIFHNGGATPSWADVHAWTSETARAENAPMIGASTVTGDQVARAIDVGIGTTIKALGGYISGLARTIGTLERSMRARIDGVQLALFNIASNLNQRILRVAQIQDAILKLALPNLQGQILVEKHNRQVSVLRHEAETKAWARDTIYAPLNHDIQANQVTATNQVNQLRADVPGIVEGMAPALLAGTAATLAAHALRLKSLEDEVARCLEPMCQTMGPNTDLGKFLKALKIAEWLAILAELAALRADGLDGLLGDIEGWAKTAIGTFEDVFFAGGGTLGETVKSIAGL